MYSCCASDCFCECFYSPLFECVVVNVVGVVTGFFATITGLLYTLHVSE